MNYSILKEINLILLILISGVANAQVFTKSATPWPEFPSPPKSKVEWVSNDMKVNGIPMKVLTFNSKVSKNEVIAYYQSLWDKYDPSLGIPIEAKAKYAIVNEVGPDTVVGKMVGPFYLTVKIKNGPNSTSTGTMTTSLILGNKSELNTKDITAPSNAKALSVVESADLGKVSKQVLFVSIDSISSIKNFYTSSLPQQGWLLLDSHGNGKLLNGQAGFALIFSKKNQQLDIIIGTDSIKNATVINVNLITLK